MTILQILEQDIIIGGNQLRIPDVTLIMSMISHYTYGDKSEAFEDGCPKVHKAKMRVTIEYDIIEELK